MIAFSTPPAADDVPTRFPSPFDRAAVHPLAHRAARDTMAALQASAWSSWALDTPGHGKMFGVLVVSAPDGRMGYLRAFSGMMAARWGHEGWAPPTFDVAARDAVWIPGEAALYELGADDEARTAQSRVLLPAIQDTYRFTNALGEVRALRELFAPKEPPGGAGDCAAPKLLAQAYALGLRPLALAEFWWGAPPRTGDRRAGSFYPACQGKCPPILAH
ncbi:MAG: RluA family pseudouridine synthase, partial [Gemmatimonadota bacterium]|nr:RluA family pseudouridine synthase [Gemmatimonadota bacterium]